MDECARRRHYEITNRKKEEDDYPSGTAGRRTTEPEMETERHAASGMPRRTETMRAIARRIERLEERFGPPVESWETQEQRRRLEAARLRCGVLPPFPERLAELKGMTIVDILNSSRQAGKGQKRGEK